MSLPDICEAAFTPADILTRSARVDVKGAYGGDLEVRFTTQLLSKVPVNLEATVSVPRSEVYIPITNQRVCLILALGCGLRLPLRL